MTKNSISVDDLARAVDGRFEGDGSIEVRRPNEPSLASADEVALAADPKYIEALKLSKARVAILPEGVDWQNLGLEAAIFVTSARKTMVEMSKAMEVPWSLHWLEAGNEVRIHPTAIVHSTAVLAKDVIIGPFTIIGENTKIGAGSIIHDHVSIAQDVSVGENSRLYAGVRIGPDVILGRDVIVMCNSVIGADGFSYLTPNASAIRRARDAGDAASLSDMEIERINSLGSVLIDDRVEIGAGVMIDRGTLKNTHIGAGTKIDNLVHIAHNVQIGQNCLICGQVGIAGSATIGDRTILGGQVGVSDNITVGSDVIAAGKSALSSTVPKEQVVMGNPAIKMSSNIESYKAYRRLPRLMKRVKDLEKKLSESENVDE